VSIAETDRSTQTPVICPLCDQPSKWSGGKCGCRFCVVVQNDNRFRRKLDAIADEILSDESVWSFVEDSPPSKIDQLIDMFQTMDRALDDLRAVRSQAIRLGIIGRKAVRQ
jgi:hypothetical protein